MSEADGTLRISIAYMFDLFGTIQSSPGVCNRHDLTVSPSLSHMHRKPLHLNTPSQPHIVCIRSTTRLNGLAISGDPTLATPS